MLICQPIRTTISTNDFQNGTYTFSVESTLEARLAPGRLIVSASAGYLLTTSSTNMARREHTLEHKQQANGTWLATGSVTVVSNNEIPTDGKIIIKNAQAESVVLSIEAPSTIIDRSSLPAALSVNQSSLAFSPTTPDKPSFLVFTITPEQANSPVTITTDLPEVFQLASDNRSHFGPALTVTPSPIGTHVHVRYVSSKYGMHSGQLLIHSDSETKSVALTACTNRLLLGWPVPATQPVWKRIWVGLGSVLIVGSLAFAGYSNRCQLFPALCQDRIANQNTIETGGPVLDLKRNIILTADKLDKPNRIQKKRTKTARPSTRLPSKRDTTNADMSILEPKSQVVDNSHQSKMGPSNTDKRRPMVEKTNQQPVFAPTQESELEHALNHPVPN